MTDGAKAFLDDLIDVYNKYTTISVKEKGIMILTMMSLLIDDYPVTKDYFDKVWLKLLFNNEPPGNQPAENPVNINQ